MKTFPKSFKPENKTVFQKVFLKRMKCSLRKEIFEHVLIKEETEYFSLDNFIEKIGKKEAAEKIIQDVIAELQELGWKCGLSFGGTGLFIYVNEKPSNFFESL